MNIRSSISRVLKIAVLCMIRVYRLSLSPLLGPACRFEPSCSEYASICVERFGVWRGMRLAVRRLARCHPWGGAGYDPPPSAALPTKPVEDT